MRFVGTFTEYRYRAKRRQSHTRCRESTWIHSKLWSYSSQQSHSCSELLWAATALLHIESAVPFCEDNTPKKILACIFYLSGTTYHGRLFKAKNEGNYDLKCIYIWTYRSALETLVACPFQFLVTQFGTFYYNSTTLLVTVVMATNWIILLLIWTYKGE